MYQVKRMDVVLDQLDWAIRLFLDHKAYVPAITLAAAAEEIIGKNLGEKSAQAKMLLKLSEAFKLPASEIRDNHLNQAKNLLKHWSEKEQEKTMDLENEAIQYLCRALINLRNYNQSLPSEGERFLLWLKKNNKISLDRDFEKLLSE